MYHNNFNLEPLLMEEINRIEQAFELGTNLVVDTAYTDDGVDIMVKFKYQDITFVEADFVGTNDNTPYEAIQAATEIIRRRLMAQVFRYIIGMSK